MEKPRMKFRTSVVVLLCLLLVSTALTACSIGSKDESATSTSTTDTTASASPTSAARPSSTPTRAASPTPQATATATTEASPTATTPAASPTTSGDVSTEIEDQLALIEQRVADVRGLTPKIDVQSEVIPRDQLHDNMMQMLQDSYSQDEATRDAQEMWLLRLIDDPTLDLWQLYVDLYSERVLGYYSPESDELFVISDDSGLTPLAQMTMAHEYTHALQDQYYDLQTLQPEDMPADQGGAHLALIEGDAELTATRYALQYMTKADLQQIVAESGEVSSAVVDNAPAYVRESLYFPYTQGSQFVMQLFQTGGEAAIDEAFQDPPSSTEQILHLDKYLGANRDEPQDIAAPDLAAALGAGWSTQDDDTLGEFDIQIMLRENGADNWKNAAAGWDGAHYALYTNGDKAVIALATVWDTEADAAEFVAALGQTFGTDTPAGQVIDAGQGRYAAITHNGANVTLITGTDEAAVAAAIGS
jgi:hypothetical protein